MKRLWIALLGGTVLALGVVMILLPGPAILVIPAGLAILATEFLWARRYLCQCRKFCDRANLPRKPRAWLRWLCRPKTSVTATRRAPTASTPLPRWMP